MTKPTHHTSGAADLLMNTEAGRKYVAEYFISIGRHDFADYIAHELAGDFACVLAHALAAGQAVAPAGYALVPMRPNRAMQEVFEEEGWQWEDVLAAAEVITESDHEAISRNEPTDDEIRESFTNYGAVMTSKHLEAVREIIAGLPQDRALRPAPPAMDGGEDARAAWDALWPAARDVLSERRRQVSSEGWTQAHDDHHDDGSLAAAAACYASVSVLSRRGDVPVSLWPRSWSPSWWKPSNPRRNLIKAGALILAEIERIDRAAARAAQKEGL